MHFLNPTGFSRTSNRPISGSQKSRSMADGNHLIPATILILLRHTPYAYQKARSLVLAVPGVRPPHAVVCRLRGASRLPQHSK